MIETPSTARRWRTRAALAVALVIGVTCLGAQLRQGFMKTVEAARGEETPVAVANAYLRAVFETGDSADINRCLCGDNRDELFQQARALRKQVEPHAAFGVEVETSDWHTIDSDDTVSAFVSVRFTQIDPATGAVTSTGGTAHKWQFRTTKERGPSGGWKVCRIDAPPLCGTHLRC
ncbi:hypothetical protein [Micromonospora sp. KLBMP9576]|uniref:hypothetical protein n=1 Tax=Micromonospora sp. KLBMP9576 TaxID=3424769 RepID=UPI003D8E6652